MAHLLSFVHTVLSGTPKILELRSQHDPRLLNPSHLATYDILLLSYETLRGDIYRDAAGDSPLTSLAFRRIILDESQKIKNKNTNVSEMANKLRTHAKWCVTGTPAVGNSIENMHGLLQFLFPELDKPM